MSNKRWMIVLALSLFGGFAKGEKKPELQAWNSAKVAVKDKIVDPNSADFGVRTTDNKVDHLFDRVYWVRGCFDSDDVRGLRFRQCFSVLVELVDEKKFRVHGSVRIRLKPYASLPNDEAKLVSKMKAERTEEAAKREAARKERLAKMQKELEAKLAKEEAERKKKMAEAAKKKREADAASELRYAKKLISRAEFDKAGPRLRDIVKNYPDTTSAAEAKSLLKKYKFPD